ncbi:M50 family metallopeptidase [Chlamydiales bacterium]|nr:M50 family metallopeptidase [Chlamydiales bacterium]
MLTLPGRIPIHIHPFFWLLCLAIGWLNALSLEGVAIWGVVVFISVLFHEMGHALFSLLFGQEVAITLFALGGVTERRSRRELPVWKEFIIVLFGPLFGFILAFSAYALLQKVPDKWVLLSYGLSITYMVNLFWTVLNLFPIQPMDGGKLLSLVLQHFFGLRGLKFAFLISIIVGVLFGGGHVLPPSSDDWNVLLSFCL